MAQTITITLQQNSVTMTLQANAAISATLSIEQFDGSECTGSDGDANRTLTLSSLSSVSFVAVDTSLLQRTNHYTVSGSVITFLNRVFDAQKITVYGK